MWDQDQETAVQSPYGGTKVGWGGPPLPPKHGRNRQRFDFTVADVDLEGEIDRLIVLGATRIGGIEHGLAELTDPDGNEFSLTAVTAL